MNIAKMMRSMTDMQSKMSDMQNRLGDIEVVGQSGGGLVTVTMNGKAEMRKIIIDPKLINIDEKETGLPEESVTVPLMVVCAVTKSVNTVDIISNQYFIIIIWVLK